MSELVSAGAAKADSAAAAVEGADAVVTMLPSSPHVKDVYLSSVFPAAAEGTLCIDCSTIDPNTTRELAGAAQEAKVRSAGAVHLLLNHARGFSLAHRCAWWTRPSAEEWGAQRLVP